MKKSPVNQYRFIKFDLCDHQRLSELFKSEKIDAVIHFAGLKAVGESVEKALLYYKNNLESTLVLLDVMQEFDVKKFGVFQLGNSLRRPRSIANYRRYAVVCYKSIRSDKVDD